MKTTSTPTLQINGQTAANTRPQHKQATMPRTRAPFIQRHATHFLTYQLVMVALLLAYLSLHGPSQTATPSIAPRWGPLPQSQRCAKKFRTATLLAFFVGSTGADQWFAHHWVLAVFKMLILFPSMLCTVVSTLSGFRSGLNVAGPTLVFMILARVIYEVWWTVDVVLWIVGGVYGIPGCGGGYGG
ncbi:hypothetical protein DL98DRAFT_594274 [Cadophora sp. DSE1049]|nr:hypothetical protein DL98DRAFT_594274 [Cadophora sp. DSE1049]